MSTTYYENIDELWKKEGYHTYEAIVQEVAQEVERILLKHIKTDIYDAYKPKDGAWVGGTTYKRRHTLERNIRSTLEPDGTFVTTSDAPANECVVAGWTFNNEDSGFIRLLESGHMGIWRNGFARPVIRNAQREVDNSPKIRAILNNV